MADLSVDDRVQKAECIASSATRLLSAIAEALGNTNGDPEVSLEMVRDLRSRLDRLAVQADRARRAWEDDPTSIYTENAIRELHIRTPELADNAVRSMLDELAELRKVAGVAEELVDEIKADNRTDEEQEALCEAVYAYRTWARASANGRQTLRRMREATHRVSEER